LANLKAQHLAAQQQAEQHAEAVRQLERELDQQTWIQLSPGQSLQHDSCTSQPRASVARSLFPIITAAAVATAAAAAAATTYEKAAAMVKIEHQLPA
jgi:hypothetical protein